MSSSRRWSTAASGGSAHGACTIGALVSLGEPRKFLLRPRGGGKSRAFHLGGGDLLVTGGQTQRAWEHSVPKVAQAGPRISVAYRYGMATGKAASDEY